MFYLNNWRQDSRFTTGLDTIGRRGNLVATVVASDKRTKAIGVPFGNSMITGLLARLLPNDPHIE